MSRYGVERYGVTRYSRADKQLLCDHIPEMIESEEVFYKTILNAQKVKPDMTTSIHLKPIMVNAKEE
jgi:hypothetical protein